MTATLAAASGKFTSICGFSISFLKTGTGATTSRDFPQRLAQRSVISPIINSVNPFGVPPGVNQKRVLQIPATFTAQEILTLADRLYGGGASRLFDHSPSPQIDLRIASRILRAIIAKIDAAAAA